jgi:hypothetical protein
VEFIYYESPIPHIIIENFYSAEELINVWKELNFLTKSGSLKPPSQTGSATKNNVVLKSNSGVFLQQLFAHNHGLSCIIKYNKKILIKETRDALSANHFVFKYLNTSRLNLSLVSYYENNNYYLPHVDNSTLSMCIWMFKEPKKFSGGTFNFSDFQYSIPVRNNTAVFFPSCIRHSVDEIVMNDPNNPIFSGDGRYVITNFIFNTPYL